MNKTCYYAHGMITYGSDIERQDIAALESIGLAVFNPNNEKTQEDYKYWKDIENWHDQDIDVMQFWNNLACQFDVVAFRGLPDGNVLSGVSSEVSAAIQAGITVIELPSLRPERFKNYEFTKNYMLECGHYKQF